MTGWIDAHNHLQDPRLGNQPAVVIAAMRAAGVTRCVVNATREADWRKILLLAAEHPGFVTPALGIHPWHAHTATPGWEFRLRTLLESHPAATLGECGLDRWVATPPITIQLPVFLQHLRLARELDRPLTIHCLKAWGALDDAFAAEPPPPRFLLHSFSGSLETARHLLKSGAYLSFSGHFLHPRKAAVIDVFRALPLDRILLESDAPDMTPPVNFITHPLPSLLNHPANVPAIGQALAVLLDLPPAQLASRLHQNLANFLTNPPVPPPPSLAIG